MFAVMFKDSKSKARIIVDKIVMYSPHRSTNKLNIYQVDSEERMELEFDTLENLDKAVKFLDLNIFKTRIV